ncbi:VpsF family polysaccharide biosynthesis protein [Methylobacterium sp. WCS2018Hpa-22]|uniref:VpsF family polysaccharide biosynthesis protein n=1 Tax=unclassified Methylobacterium TaxID=2615210 RepID=UPI0028890EEF|nr:VpsF family polysaccharide biosynthesis protein [Methylobacterium sp. WCS2018Hpa-22]
MSRSPMPFGLIALTVLILGVSGGMLWNVGINYDGLTGAAPQKIHPSTYLVLVLFGWAALKSGNPASYLVYAVQVRPAGMLLAVCSIGLFLHIVLRSGPGMAGALDTFLLPGLFAVLLADRDALTWRRLELTVHAVMLVNALLGLTEFATKTLFFPYRLDGQVFATDTRSAALQGHPLGNATLTACYVLALIGGGGRMTVPQRLAMIGLQLAALVAFGGRSAMVVTLIFGGGYGLFALHKVLSAGRIPLLAAAAGIFLFTLVPLGIGGLAAGGFFDALLSRFMADGGSANARVEMLDLVASIPFRELLVGPDMSLVDSLRRVSGLEWGIENPIVRTLVYQGIFMTVLLTAAVTLYMMELVRHCRTGTFLPVIAFVILVNTFEGIGGKTTLLAKFAILLLGLFHAVSDRPPERADRGR